MVSEILQGQVFVYTLNKQLKVIILVMALYTVLFTQFSDAEHYRLKYGGVIVGPEVISFKVITCSLVFHYFDYNF